MHTSPVVCTTTLSSSVLHRIWHWALLSSFTATGGSFFWSEVILERTEYQGKTGRVFVAPERGGRLMFTGVLPDAVRGRLVPLAKPPAGATGTRIMGSVCTTADTSTCADLTGKHCCPAPRQGRWGPKSCLWIPHKAVVGLELTAQSDAKRGVEWNLGAQNACPTVFVRPATDWPPFFVFSD